MAQTRKGDPDAFQNIFAAYHLKLCAFAAGYLGSFEQGREVVQEVFLKIWERHPDWHVRTSLKAYLYRAVRNQSLDHIRRRRSKYEHEVPLPLDENFFADPCRVDEALMYRDLVQAVRQAIQQLPERRRTAFVLHRQHRLTYVEIGQAMDISPRTVEVHIGNALKDLRDVVPGACS